MIVDSNRAAGHLWSKRTAVQIAPVRLFAALASTLFALLAFSNPANAQEERSQTERISSVTDPAELRCLALSIYWEAKAEAREGQVAVGNVVLNRVESPRFPNSPCAVVFDGGETRPCQFSWYCDGKSDKPTEAKNWANAQRLAEQMLTGPRNDNTGGAVFFHGKQMSNPWRVPRTKTVTIGNHVFYKL